MVIKTNQINFFNGLIQIILPPGHIEQANDLGQALNKGKRLVVKIEPEKKKRSLTANGLLWLALQHLAMEQHTTKEELYIWYLRTHGTFDYIAVLPKALDRIKQIYRIVDELGTFKTDKGSEMLKLRVYAGSSTYDKKEFSYLLERVLEDACKGGFQMLADEELNRLLEDRENGKNQYGR